MNVAAIKLGARIASGGTSGGSGEALAILNMLHRGGANVTAYTKILPKDDEIPGIEMRQILEEHPNAEDFDALVVINGSVNYFGGADDPAQTQNYAVINNFDGPVYYIYCDPSLVLKQIWPSIEKKPWADQYDQEEIEISRTDITYICQPKNVGKCLIDINKKGKISIGSSIVHYPFEKFPLLGEQPEWLPLEAREFDLLYGGTFRGGKRQDDMIKFYFGLDGHNVEMFGNIKEGDFNQKKINGSFPKFGKAVKYNEFNEKMSKAVATVIIGDEYYKTVDDLAQRIYESILAGVVTFIDSSYDKNKRVFKDETLRKFLYVSSREDLKKKLDTLKQMSNSQFTELLNRQLEDVRINTSEYCKNFVNLLKG